MPLGTPAPPNKRKKSSGSKIITDLSHVTQDEYDSEPEASEFDLGTKIRTPRDIMLEELSLMKNRGSKMFRMRQKRVEKFIYENNPDLFSSESMKLVPSLSGQIMNVGGHFLGMQAGGGAPVPPPKPGSKGMTGAVAGGGAGGAGGTGGGVGGSSQGGTGAGVSEWTPLKGGGMDDPTNKQKSYLSPWEKAMKGDENLTVTMRSKMAGPSIQPDLPKYRSFNRTAMPFGGYEKASMYMKFQLPDIEQTKQEPEPAVVYQHAIGCRPSFNRTPIGWVGSIEPGSIHMETDSVPFDGETDDL